MPSAMIHKVSNNHESMPFSGDRVFEKFFEEGEQPDSSNIIASPELTLLDDVPQDIDQKPQIHLPPPYPTVPHPYLHRLQVLPSGPPMGVLKSNPYHIHHQPITTTPPSSGGGISPDLTWSGDPSPISPNDSPNLLTVDDDLDLEGEEFKAPLFTPFTVSPQSTANSQSPPSSGKRSSGRGRNASRGQNNSGASTHSRASSRSRSLRSNSSSIGASDELTMSDLSLHHQHGAGTTSLRALLSCPPSPTGGHASPAVQLATSAPPRKKAHDDTPMAGAGGGGSSTGGTAPTRPGVSTATANDGPHEPTSPTTTTSPMEDLSQESSSLLSAIEAKRRQNTLAARRSRQRKLDYVRNLEELLAAMTKERNLWKARAEKAEKVLGYRPGEDDEDEEEQEAE
ncbi:hypothetical protein FRB95_012382 [Tulasnella sp. JGI-2019a]|nr:hypothetical protein FRB95_012382 [Tulasnella sp. JGI-2019a]